MTYDNAVLGSQTTWDLAIGVFEDAKAAFYDVKYPELQWKEVIPSGSIDTSINAGAHSTSYRSRDRQGKGAFISTMDQGVPTVGNSVTKINVNLYVAGVGATFSRDDARAMQKGYSTNLMSDLTSDMRLASERHVDDVVFYGDDNMAITGWLDLPNVTATAVPNGAGGFPEWSTKTPEEILFDLNNALVSLWENSKQVHLPDTMYLPTAQYGLIATTRANTTNADTILTVLKQNNLYTNLTGKELTVKPIRHLDGAGVASVDRMVVADTRSENLLLPFSIPFELLPPQLSGYNVELLSEYKFGSVHIRYPLSMNYFDSI